MRTFFANLLGRTTWPDVSVEEVRRRSRIVVIDDQDFPYLGLFHKDGYNVDKWDDVKDLSKLEAGYYDVILLDIQGVGKNHSEEQGAGILRHLRMISPAQLLIAYSNSDWPMKYQEFFQMADARLQKTSDYVHFKEIVDDLLEKRFSLGFYVERVVKVAGAHVSNTDQLRKLARKALESGSTKKLERFLSKASDDSTVWEVVSKVLRTGLRVAAVFKVTAGAVAIS